MRSIFVSRLRLSLNVTYKAIIPETLNSREDSADEGNYQGRFESQEQPLRAAMLLYSLPTLSKPCVSSCAKTMPIPPKFTALCI